MPLAPRRHRGDGQRRTGYSTHTPAARRLWPRGVRVPPDHTALPPGPESTPDGSQGNTAAILSRRLTAAPQEKSSAESLGWKAPKVPKTSDLFLQMETHRKGERVKPFALLPLLSTLAVGGLPDQFG